MKVFLDTTEVEVPEGSTLSDVMKKCGMSTQDFLARKAGKLIHDNQTLEDGDRISTIRVVSGG